MTRSYLYGLLLFILITSFCSAQTKLFPLVTDNSKVTIVYSGETAKLDSIAAHLLAEDIERVTGYKPAVTADLGKANGHIIVIGAIHSKLVQRFAGTKALQDKLGGKWECHGLQVIDSALVIAGSDARGTAYGVFSLSEKIGVSPWYWWADVPVTRQAELVIQLEEHVSSPPSVKYRGIFINDEDWGLLPWAANTFEPEQKNIGPRTYAKVFELLLRLKANLLWPAMHPGTAPFYTIPGNRQTAALYSIVVGTSHAEPMMRNNVGEWDEKTMGKFNYLTNKEKVFEYWESRAKETAGDEVVYTLGMRGVHDSQMEGVKTAKDAVPLVEGIFKEQRGLLEKYSGKDAAAIPQVFTAYKEVLDIYEAGLKLPDDVTFVWPDDNYGYIHQLNTDAERKRGGGSGVYYHASYWGRPHDYLWLSTTHPSLIRSEMMKAFESGAERMWVLNVGDIKPLEYNIQLFMDMAWDATFFKESSYTKQHVQSWLTRLFDRKHAGAITPVMWEYYHLAFERRPEFMGWSQTEPTTKTKLTTFNHFSYGDEAQRRIDRYEALEKQVKQLRKQITPAKEPAFYQLVYYPVVCASWMNKKFLYRDKAHIYAKQNRIQAYESAAVSAAAYDSIVKETVYFNEQLSGGKWKGMMSMQPRNLPVFHKPEIIIPAIDKKGTWNVSPEGADTIASQSKLPVFVGGLKRSYFIDIYLSDSVTLSWTAKASANWIRLSAQKGTLNARQSAVRIWVSVDWGKRPAKEGRIVISANGKNKTISVMTKAVAYKGFVEDNGVIAIRAVNYQSKTSNSWQVVEGLGHTNASLQAIRTDSSFVDYDFLSFSDTTAKLLVYTLPTHPLNKSVGASYGVSIDGSPMKVVSFKTAGRSEEWKQNVLRNAAIKEIELPALKPGHHTLRIYAIDPGLILDRIVIRFGNAPESYGVVAETRKE